MAELNTGDGGGGKGGKVRSKTKFQSRFNCNGRFGILIDNFLYVDYIFVKTSINGFGSS